MNQSQLYSPRKIQQLFFESLGNRDWDMYTVNDYQYLKFRIAYAFYGPPMIESDIDDIENNSGYTKIQNDEIFPIYNRILSFARYSANGKNIYMTILFVCKVPGGKLPEDLIYAENTPSAHIEMYPVFKIRKCINAEKEGCSIFLDDVGRQYKNWNEYLVKNKLSKGIIISPSNGRYCGSFKETISLKDPESRGYWLNIGAGAAGAVAGVGSQILTNVASEGMVIGNGIKIVHDTAVIAAVVTGGVGFINSVGSSILRYKETGIMPNNLELFQMASSALFLTNSLINNKMASTIITETQSGVIYNVRSMLGNGKARTVFDKLVVETQRITGQSGEGNSEVIQRISRIDLHQLCSSAIKVKEQIDKYNAKTSPRNDGIPLVNGTDQVDPHSLTASSSSANQNAECQNVNKHQSNTENVTERSQTEPCYLTGIAEGVFTCSISIAKIVHSFPSLSMSEPGIVEDLCKLFSNFTDTTYTLFVLIVKNVLKATTIKLLQQSRALVMEETQLLEKLIRFVHSTLLYHCEMHDIKISQSIEEYCKHGHILQLLVQELYDNFQNSINCKYQCEAGYKEIKCSECDGLRFSAN